MSAPSDQFERAARFAECCEQAAFDANRPGLEPDGASAGAAAVIVEPRIHNGQTSLLDGRTRVLEVASVAVRSWAHHLVDRSHRPDDQQDPVGDDALAAPRRSGTDPAQRLHTDASEGESGKDRADPATLSQRS